VVINDGSKDATLDVLKREFELVAVQTAIEPAVATKPVRQVLRSRTHRNLVVVDKENGGKADALNVGLNVSGGTLVCAIDADTLIEADALQRMVQPFLEHSETIAAGGTVRVANGGDIRNGRVVTVRAPRTFLAGIQAVEYLRAYLFGRLGWNKLGGNLIISGAFGLFRRDAMIAAGGYAPDTVGEDMEIVVRLRRRAYEQKRPHRVAFVPDPVAWTEVPESARVLARQRDRWHRGLADVLWRHRVMLFNPRYGSVAFIGYPYFVFVELLAPVLEAVGLVGTAIGLFLGVVNVPFAILFFFLAYGYGAVLTLATLLLEEVSFRRYSTMRDRLLLVFWALIENFGYRQRTVVWRVRGIWKYLRGRKDWGAMERRGLVKPAAPGVTSGTSR
jgi:cellulose synthase/poly-beta-1,6-N-acetylglucosamine synthase-like glycosyltransferase